MYQEDIVDIDIEWERERGYRRLSRDYICGNFFIYFADIAGWSKFRWKYPHKTQKNALPV